MKNLVYKHGKVSKLRVSKLMLTKGIVFEGRFLNFKALSRRARSSGAFAMLKVNRAIRKELSEFQ